MDDDLIINELASYDEYYTKKYFYGYCRKAYNIFDHKYQLRSKTGLDFYTLAHDYYIYLMVHEFKPLFDRPKNVKLSTWMTNGFHFVVLDALKAYNKEFSQLSNTVSDGVLEYIRATDHEEGMMEQVTQAISRHYTNDLTMKEIGYMLFFEGYSQKEVAAKLDITPSAVNQRYKKMMDEVVTPFVIENYSQGIYESENCKICKKEAICFAEEQAHYSILPRFSFIGDICHKFITPMHNNRITPDHISTLKPGEVFVFGSNLKGMHGGGAAYAAMLHFGAEWGNGDGIQGQSYAIPTMQGGTETIKPYVDKFIEFAKQHPEMTFLVTPIGCGIAGFEPDDIAPLFSNAKDIKNIHLPESFWDVLDAGS